MRHKKPRGRRYAGRGQRNNQRRPKRRNLTALHYIGGAALFGVVIGTGSIALSPNGPSTIMATVKPFAVQADLMRKRSPQEGDSWSGCDAAREAGTAPIYIGEPGYRSGMDGDGDGIACEPYRGL